MLALEDTRWATYKDAMGTQFDAVSMLRQLLDSGANERIWDDCWNHLVYQEDIGQLSYAAVPYLAAFIRKSKEIDWNALALISAIELARLDGPAVPEEVRQGYCDTIQSMPLILAQHSQTQWDDLTTRCAASCIALARGQRQLATIYLEMSLADGIEWLQTQSER